MFGLVDLIKTLVITILLLVIGTAIGLQVGNSVGGTGNATAVNLVAYLGTGSGSVGSYIGLLVTAFMGAIAIQLVLRAIGGGQTGSY